MNYEKTEEKITVIRFNCGLNKNIDFVLEEVVDFLRETSGDLIGNPKYAYLRDIRIDWAKDDSWDAVIVELYEIN